MAIKRKEALFGDNGPNGKQVPIDLQAPLGGYAPAVRAIGFGEQLTSRAANRMLYALALNDEDLETQIGAAITALTQGYMAADQTLKTQLQTAYQAADATVANNATTALNTQIARLNQVLNYDLVTNTAQNPKPAINSKVADHETRIVSLEQTTTSSGLASRVGGLEDLSANVASMTLLKALRDKLGSSALVTAVTNLEGKSGSSTLVTSVTNLEGKAGSSALVTAVTNLEGVAGSSALVTLIKGLRDLTPGAGAIVTTVNAHTVSIGDLYTQVGARVIKAGDSMTGPLSIAPAGGNASTVALQVTGSVSVSGGATLGGQVTTTGSIRAANYNFTRTNETRFVPMAAWRSSDAVYSASPDGNHRAKSWNRISGVPGFDNFLGQWCIGSFAGTPMTVPPGCYLMIPLSIRLPVLAQVKNVRLYGLCTNSGMNGQFQGGIYQTGQEPTARNNPIKINGNQNTIPLTGFTSANDGSFTVLDFTPDATVSFTDMDLELVIWNSVQITNAPGQLRLHRCDIVYDLGVLLG